jgi:hypothetical protein
MNKEWVFLVCDPTTPSTGDGFEKVRNLFRKGLETCSRMSRVSYRALFAPPLI